VDRCVTSTPEGFRLASRKLRVLQQGIDTQRFRPPVARTQEQERRVVALGRLSPVKRLVETIEAVHRARELGAPLTLTMAGGPLRPEDVAYEQQLRRRIGELDLAGVVELRGPVAPAHAPSLYREGGIYLNLSRSGSLDKTIPEAMASGCIPISSNDAFAGLARQHGWHELVTTEEEAPAALARAAAMARDARAALRAELRACVCEEHALAGLADRIVAELADLAASPPRGVLRLEASRVLPGPHVG